MRMSRRLGLVGGLELPSLYEFWSDATIVATSGASSSTAQYYTDISIGDTSTPLWIVASKGDALSFDKIKANEHTTLKWFLASDYEEPMQVFISRSGTSTTNATKVDVNMQAAAYSPIYGYALSALRFPSFSETVVDQMLSDKMRVEFLENAYNYGSDASTVYIAGADLSNDPNDVYLQFACSSSIGYISATRGGTPGTAIMSSGSRAFWRQYYSQYYFSTNGTTNGTTRAGGLYRLSL